MAQTLIVTLLVVACSLRAAWILAPANARRAAARRLLALALPMPGGLAARLRKHADDAGSGCACDGCGHASAAKDAKSGRRGIGGASPSIASVAPITFHRRLPR
jgi:hypothetical protein